MLCGAWSVGAVGNVYPYLLRASASGVWEGVAALVVAAPAAPAAPFFHSHAVSIVSCSDIFFARSESRLSRFLPLADLA